MNLFTKQKKTLEVLFLVEDLPWKIPGEGSSVAAAVTQAASSTSSVPAPGTSISHEHSQKNGKKQAQQRKHIYGYQKIHITIYKIDNKNFAV